MCNHSVKYFFLFLFIPLCLALPQDKTNIYDQIVYDRTSNYYHMPVGLCEDYPEETTTQKIIMKDLEFLRKNNVNLLRISFGWDAIEEEKGKFNWLFWDEYVKTAVDKYGITLIPYVCYTPKWASTGEKDSSAFWSYPPKNNSYFADFMKVIVNRYKDRIKTWELWNEPDIDTYWKGTQEEFAEMIKAGSKAVKEADPDAKIVLGGIAYDPYFIKNMFTEFGLSPFIDIVNCHNYYETWHMHPIEEISTYINEISDIIGRHGSNQALWVAEVGYSTFRKGDFVSDVYDPYYIYEHTPAYQAVKLFKTLVLIYATSKVEAVAWYELKDLPHTESVIGDNDNNRFLGITYHDLKPKPAVRSIGFFRQLFSKRIKSINQIIKTDLPVDSDVEVNAFQDATGNTIVTAWLKTAVPGKKGNRRSGSLKDERTAQFTVTLPFNLKGKVTAYDELGEILDPPLLKKVNRQTIIGDISVKGGEITIIKLEN